MKLLYFRHKKANFDGIAEFVVLCDDGFEKETVKEHGPDGYVLQGTFDLMAEKGSESDLPTDRMLVPE